MYVCVFSISPRHSSIQPATTAAFLSAFSPATVSSRHAITLSNETGENASQEASCKHTVPESITSLFPSLCSWFTLSPSVSLSHQFIPHFIQIGLYNIVAAGWMSVERRREIGIQTYCHTVIGTKTWLMLSFLLPSLLTLSLWVSLTQYSLLSPSLSVNFSLFCHPLVVSFILGCSRLTQLKFGDTIRTLCLHGSCIPWILVLIAV